MKIFGICIYNNSSLRERVYNILYNSVMKGHFVYLESYLNWERVTVLKFRHSSNPPPPPLLPCIFFLFYFLHLHLVNERSKEFSKRHHKKIYFTVSNSAHVRSTLISIINFIFFITKIIYSSVWPLKEIMRARKSPQFLFCFRL